MKRFWIIAIPLVLLLVPQLGYSQCKNFAKKVCKSELAPYLHDGNYNAAILTEGEDDELFKTFYAGQEYRIAVCASSTLPKVEFILMDTQRNVLYSNKSNNYTPYYDFKAETTQMLIISVKVSNKSTTAAADELVSGCVAIMFGLKMPK